MFTPEIVIGPEEREPAGPMLLTALPLVPMLMTDAPLDDITMPVPAEIEIEPVLVEVPAPRALTPAPPAEPAEPAEIVIELLFCDSVMLLPPARTTVP